VLQAKRGELLTRETKHGSARGVTHLAESLFCDSSKGLAEPNFFRMDTLLI